MRDEPTHNVEAILAAFTERFPVKVWSYITTIFGDLTEDSGFEISGPTLSQLTECIGLKPEAVRVALHRLRKDNWISVRKVGRISCYRLSAERLLETREAGKRIFSPQQHKTREVFVTLSDPDLAADSDPKPNLVLAKGVTVSTIPPAKETKPCLILETSSDKLPDWIRQKFVNSAWEHDCRDFLDLVRSTEKNLGSNKKLSDVERVSLRLLLVHNWRRIVLRLPEETELLQSRDWIGNLCRTEVLALLERLPRAELGHIVAARMQEAPQEVSGPH